MVLQNSLPQLKALLTPAERVLILIGGDSGDCLIAGVSLGLSLERSGKRVDIFAPRLPDAKPEKSLIVGLDKIKTGFGQKDLHILFDYPLEGIEKVSSQEEGSRLKLVVKMKPEAAPIKTSQVKVVARDFDYDFGIMIGDESLFPGFSKLAGQIKWVWMGKENQEKKWAQVSLLGLSSSFSEIVARMVQNLGLAMDRDIAGNLYQGIREATGFFRQLDSYRTLETAALCYKVSESGYAGNGNDSVSKSAGEIKFETAGSEAAEIPIGEVENKEGGGSLPTPKIFKGSTTPRI